MSLLINGASLDALVYAIYTLEGHLAPATLLRAPIERTDAPGGLATRVSVAARTLSHTVDLRPLTLPDRITLLETLLARCQGVTELRISDAPDRRWWGVLQAAPLIELADAPYSNPQATVTLVWRLDDPRAEAIEPTVLALSGTATACPLWTGAVTPEVVLFGASTPVVNPVIEVVSPRGSVLSTLALTDSLGSGESLTIDSSTEAVWRRSGGATTLALGVIASGAFPILDPLDSPRAGPWPALRLSATSGTPTGVVRYRKLA